MAVIEHIAVRKTPLALLKYITGESKKERAALVTGLNCSKDAKSAYEEMGFCYECYAGEKLSAKPKGEGKQKIKLHHYIQSFKEGEVTPQEAHDIAVNWAKSVFGRDRQILIATHTDAGHIHSHFAVNAYDTKGVHWIDNKKTLQKCRDVSDSILKGRGLSVIEKSYTRKDLTYAEWLESKKGTSWKDVLRSDIDRIVLMGRVQSIDDLLEELMKSGYIVKRKKYISVMPADLERTKFVRTYRLGDGYSLEHLEFRIKKKNIEMSLEDVLEYDGIQQEYALCVRAIEKVMYRNEFLTHKCTYKELCQGFELLSYVKDHCIHSKDDFKRHLNRVAEKCDKVINSSKEMEQKIKDYEYLLERTKRFKKLYDKGMNMFYWEADELCEIKEIADKYNFSADDDPIIISEALEKAKAEYARMEEGCKQAKAEKKAVGDRYKLFIDQIETDYSRLLRDAKEELRKYEESKNNQKTCEEELRAKAERKKQKEAEIVEEGCYEYDYDDGER